MKKGKTRLFYGASPKYGTIALVGIGKEELVDKDYKDGVDPKKENIRVASASNIFTYKIFLIITIYLLFVSWNRVSDGCRSLTDCGIEDIYVSAMGDSESAAEGSVLGTWKFQEYKKKKDIIPKISLFEDTDGFVKLFNKYCIKKYFNYVK